MIVVLDDRANAEQVREVQERLHAEGYQTHLSRGESKTLILDAGLWRYSRHPNYFGQWLTRIGFALIALAAPYGWTGLAAPALILVLILFVTGIPPSEEQALKHRGDDYRRYQQETSSFLPFPPRKAA